MKIMGIDYGDARTGVAISDLLCTLVGSATVVPSRNTEKAIADIVRLAQENKVGEIVVGLPKNMDGTEGVRAELCREFADKLRVATGLSVSMWDERRTTVEAHNILSQHNYHGKKRKGIWLTRSGKAELCLRPITQFPNPCRKEQNAEQFSEDFQIHSCADKGKDRRGGASGENGRQDFFERYRALLPTQITGNGGGGQEKQQIDAPCGGLGHFQHQRQPQNQQTSAADPQSSEKSQQGADDQRDRQAF